ncbi:MAG: type II toxin-antitoxin system HicA family toxin [Candidatus Bathyanammoxibius sp.]
MGQKLPRDVSANDLIKVLGKYYQYEIKRRKSTHIRLCTLLKGEHSITVPDHDPVKVKTLKSILREIAAHLDIHEKEIIDKLR